MKKNLLILETDRSWSHALRGTDAVVSDARDADSESLIDAAREPRVAWIVRRIAADLRGGAPALAALALALACGAPLFGCSSQDAPPAISETESALTFPTSLAAWHPIVQATGTMGDVTTDAQQDARNIVGNAAFPAVFFANDGTNFFVRLRLQENPIGTSGTLRQFGWGLLFNTDGNFDKYEYSLLLDASGNPDQIVYGHNGVAGNLGDPSDTAETVITTFVANLTAPNQNVQVDPSDSCFDAAANPTCTGTTDPDRDYFLSFGVPLAMFSLPATQPPPRMNISQPVQILAGSSSSGQNLTLDLAGCGVNPGPGTISQCQSVPMSLTCGNGVREGAEGCDDGNSASADGCNALCLIETGNACNATTPGATGDSSCASGVCDDTAGAPGTCEAANTCGNGIVEAGEGCDDGANAAGDGCNAACLIETGRVCNAGPGGATGNGSCASGVCDPTGGAPGTCEAANTCGNGVREAGEGCDDGANAAGDGCNAQCLIEDNLPCNGSAPGATSDASCASGVCDESGGAPGVCEAAGACGNGVREAGEGCDDGGSAAGDGCNASCLIENSLPCNGGMPGATGDASCASGVCDEGGGAPGVCEAAGACGNGVLEAGEGCDDGGSATGDGCSATCLIEDGRPCNATAPGSMGNASCASGVCDPTSGAPGICEAAGACGNGRLDPGEGCDDGGSVAGGGCSAGCLIDDGRPCNAMVPGSTGNGSCASGVCDMSGGAPGLCEAAAACGNGVLEAEEGCDDGGAADGDGCNASCRIEVGPPCNADPDGKMGSDSCASGVCGPDGTCVPGVGISGGGCSTGGGAGTGASFLILLGLGAMISRRRGRGRQRRCAGAICLGGLVVAGAVAGESREAAAQVSTRYSAERFELTGHRDGILGVEWGDVRGHLVVDAGLWVGYANDPINVYEMATGDRIGSLVHNRFGGDLVAAVRLWNRVELDLGASLILGQSESLDMAMLGGDISGAGLGNFRITPKVVIARSARTALAVLAGIGLPTSTVDDYGGDGSVTFSPALALSHDRGRIRLAANAGYRARSSAQALDLKIDDEIYARAGLGYRFPSSLEIDATFDIATAADDVLGAFNRNFAEVRGGASYDVTSAVRLFGAAGMGVAEGFGTPDWRMLVGVRLGTASPAERREPLPLPAPVPRDRDGDGILDVADRCPDEPETRNAFEEDDGCPDDPDPDRDNVIGAADQCPSAPEDVDGFEDGNGCPDPDNDGDTILDAADRCRDVAGVPAMQGCPDPDRDGDTVVDRVDNCPDVPGLPEHQGCKQKELVKIVDGKLEILDIVYFKLDQAVIQAKSYALLDNVARVLAAHSQIAKVRVEGHTDDQGNDAYNKKLSQRRAEAVRAYLIKKGIDAGRLDAAGFGEEQPKVDNGTIEGRATNRRVEFVIVGGADGVQTR